MADKKLSKLIRNADTFSEKGRQVSPDALVAFGIQLDSRYGKCSELIELLRFAQAAANASVAHYVKAASYDSKASVCNFELDGAVIRGSEVEIALLAVARASVKHFNWFDHEIFDGGQSDV